MPTEIPKFIKSRFGEMFIMEHHPDGEVPDYWVIALNSGLQCRTGPRRLYAHLARALTEVGVGVIRVDLSGVGDSDGPPPPTHFDMHNPDDAQAVIDYLRSEYDPKGIILQGLCAGSRVAIKTAAQDQEVAGILAWSTTVFTATPGSTRPPEEPKHGVSKAVAEYNKGRVKRVFSEGKFLKPSFWKKHLTSSRLIPDLRSAFWSAWLLLTKSSPEDHKGWFIRSITSCVASKRPIHFVYGERDQYCYMEFRNLELDVPEKDILVIPDGTHTFSTTSQREQVINNTCTWLRDNFPIDKHGVTG